MRILPMTWVRTVDPRGQKPESHLPTSRPCLKEVCDSLSGACGVCSNSFLDTAAVYTAASGLAFGTLAFHFSWFA